MEHYDVIGAAGVLTILYAYFKLQAGKMDALELKYSVLNMMGSAGILYSLFFKWNASAAMIEVAWIGISVWGIYKHKK